MEKYGKVVFNPNGKDPVEFFVIEQTRVAGSDYLLVTDSEEGDAEALILKDISEDGEEEAVYVIVSKEDELNAVAGVFENMLEDIRFVQEEE
ncbi:DUF1292 domain-containing protein [Lachnospiraceae bacterium OttesenSCG-928-D06]|nr:DUF1292 domain-containing protein [Lachnospiraceae bacterium OttesenSCG-928-D06]